MRIIVDTSILLAHLLSRGKNNTVTIFKLVKTKKVNLIVCKETLQELKTTLALAKFKNMSQYKPHVNASFIAWYQYHSQFYTITDTKLPVLSRDLHDNIFLSLANTSKSDYLITGDNDLLIIKKIGHTAIVTPEEFIKHYKPVS